MKSYITIVRAVLFGVCLSAGNTSLAQSFTTPTVTFTEQELNQGFNFLALTAHEHVVASGTFDAVDGNALTDEQIDFDTTLVAGQTYILEILTGLPGVIQEITAIAGTTLTTGDDLDVLGLTAGAQYEIRLATTLEKALGTTSSVLKNGFVSSFADIVWMSDGSGGFKRYFLKAPSNIWTNADTNAPAPNTPIIYVDGFYVQKRDAGTVNLANSGVVKIHPTSAVLMEGFNLLSRVYPEGMTVQNSGLKDSIASSFIATFADIVWLPNGSGFNRYFFTNQGELKDAGTNASVTTDIELPDAFFVQRRNTVGQVDLTPPAFYEDL